MAEIVTIGETMAVMTPEKPGLLRYHSNYRLRMAGAESNVAIGAEKLGHTAAWVTRLGDDEFGKYVLNSVRAEGVDCSRVQIDSEHRTGVMFKEMMGGETRVFYYRENSAASHMSLDTLPIDLIEKAEIVHLTGITPVLGKTCLEMTEALVQFCGQRGITISFDPNIRKTLWGDNDYSEIMKRLAARAKIIMLGREEAEIIYGTSMTDEIIQKIFQGAAEYIALKDGANGAIVADRVHSFNIPPCQCRPIDPTGAGDGFNAAFLCGILEGKDLYMCGKMGAVAGAMATETYGDIEGYPSREQMKQKLRGKAEVLR